MTNLSRILPLLTLVIAVSALVLALWPIVADAPWEDGVQEDLTGATVEPTPIIPDIGPGLTEKLIFGLVEEYAYYDNKNPGSQCISDNGVHTTWLRDRWPDFEFSFDPHYGGITGNSKWVMKTSGKYCHGVEVFLIDDETGEMTYGGSSLD